MRDFPARVLAWLHLVIKEVEVTKTKHLFTLQCKCLQFTSNVEELNRTLEWARKIAFFPCPLLLNTAKQCLLTYSEIGWLPSLFPCPISNNC